LRRESGPDTTGSAEATTVVTTVGDVACVPSGQIARVRQLTVLGVRAVQANVNDPAAVGVTEA
jgi:hypothetical protein